MHWLQPWLFLVWDVDIIGKISPKSSTGHEFILVTIDYFTSGWRLLHMRDWHHLRSLVSSDHTLSVAMESLMSWFWIEEYISEQRLTLYYRDMISSIIDHLRTGCRLTKRQRLRIRILRGSCGGWLRLLEIGQRSFYLHCGLIGLFFAPL